MWLIDDPSLVFINDQMFEEVLVDTLMTSRSGETFLHVSKEGIYPQGLGLALQKGNTFKPCIDYW